jgi:hypothetical protein
MKAVRRLSNLSAAPIQVPDQASLHLPWWTALTSGGSGARAGGYGATRSWRDAEHGVDRASLLMSAGRRKGLRWWGMSGPWVYPDHRKGRGNRGTQPRGGPS